MRRRNSHPDREDPKVNTRIGLSSFVGAVLVLGALATPVAAAPLRNDDIDSPIVIGDFPYSNTQDTQRATTGPTDPGFCYDPTGPADSNTVWYSYTATEDGRLAVSTFGSDYDTTLYVGTANDSGGIDVIGCVDDSGGGLQSYVGFDAVAGTTYLFMVGTCCGFPGSDGGGTLVFSLDVGEPALILDVTVDPTGEVDRGLVTLTGTATCSTTSDFAFIDLSLTQRVGKRTIVGFGSTELTSCGPTPTQWTLVLEGFNGRFAGGNATADVFMFACTLECANINVTVAIKLH
jgi:hypothetical protein